MTEPSHAAPPVRPAATGAVLITGGANAGLAVLGLVTGVLAARLLGPERRGHLAAAQALGTLIGTVGGLSLGEAVVYFVGKGPRSPIVVLRTATAVGAASAVVAAAVGYVAMPLLLAGQPGAVDAARAYAFVGLPLVVLGFPIGLMRGMQRYLLWNALRFVAPSCWLAALVIMAATGSSALTPLIWIFLGLQLVFAPLLWRCTGKSGGPSGSFDRKLVRPMLSYGAPLFIATLPQALNMRLDQLLIANVESAEQLGLYAVSVSWASLGIPVMAAIGSVLFPHLAGMQRDQAAAALARSARVSVVIALAVGGVSALSAPILVPLLFGSEYAVPMQLSLLLAASTSLLGVNGILEEGLRGLGEPRTVLLAELAGLAVTAPSVFLLLPLWGISGAAASTVLGYLVTGAVLVLRIRARVGIPMGELLVPTRRDVQDLSRRARTLVGRG